MAIVIGSTSTTFAQNSQTLRHDCAGEVNLNDSKSVQCLGQSQMENINAFLRPLKPALVQLQKTQKIDPVVKNTFITKLSNLIASTNALKTRGNTTASSTQLLSNGKYLQMLRTHYYPLVRQVGQLVVADRILVTADMASTTAGKIQMDLAVLKASGKDVAALETSFADVAPLILSARTIATNAVIKVNALNASSTSINSDIAAISSEHMQANRKLDRANVIFRDLNKKILYIKNGIEIPGPRTMIRSQGRQ